MQVENVHRSQTFLTARCCCAIFAYIISGQDGENNGVPPSFRAFLPPFSSLFSCLQSCAKLTFLFPCESLPCGVHDYLMNDFL